MLFGIYRVVESRIFCVDGINQMTVTVEINRNTDPEFGSTGFH